MTPYILVVTLLTGGVPQVVLLGTNTEEACLLSAPFLIRNLDPDQIVEQAGCASKHGVIRLDKKGRPT